MDKNIYNATKKEPTGGYPKPIYQMTLNELPEPEQDLRKAQASEYGKHFSIISETLKASARTQAQDILLHSGEQPLFKISGLRHPMYDVPIWTNITLDIFVRNIVMSGYLTEQVKYKDDIIHYSELYREVENTAEKILNERQGTFDFRVSFKQNNLRCHLYSTTANGKIEGKTVTRKLALNIRVVPKEMPLLDSLNLPHEFKQIFEEKSGLILVSGSAGDGKSTTVASALNEFNLTDDKYRTILTIEEPIEYMHVNKSAYFMQRNLSSLPTDDLTTFVGDVASYEKATEDALREDCDIVMIGELRNESSMHNALRLVEAGKLVIASIHGKSVIDTIDKFLGEFKLDDFEKTRKRLASNLTCILHQNLVLKDSKQYPLSSLLYIDNHKPVPNAKSSREELKDILDSKNASSHSIPTQIEKLMKNNVRCVTKEQRFEKMVADGIFSESDRARLL